MHYWSTAGARPAQSSVTLVTYIVLAHILAGTCNPLDYDVRLIHSQ